MISVSLGDLIPGFYMDQISITKRKEQKQICQMAFRLKLLVTAKCVKLFCLDWTLALKSHNTFWCTAFCLSSIFLLCHHHPHPSLLILRVSSSQRFFVSTKMMVLFSFSAMISSISWISLWRKRQDAIRLDHSRGTLGWGCGCNIQLVSLSDLRTVLNWHWVSSVQLNYGVLLHNSAMYTGSWTERKRENCKCQTFL